MIETIKKLIKRLGVYKKLEWWVVKTNAGANIYLQIMSVWARKKGIELYAGNSGIAPQFLVTIKEKTIIIAKQHFAYLQDIIDNFEYYFDAVQPNLAGSQYIVDYSTSRQHVLMPSGIPFFFSSFAEPLETTDIYLDKGTLKEGDVVLDLGSYCGSTVWGFSKAVGKSGVVYGFEPDPTNYEILCKNIEYHNLSNVIVFNKGVWATSGKLPFQGEGNMGSGLSMVQDRGTNLFDIEVISLNDFCAEFNIAKIDYIKMDIEGAEVEVLKASESLLKRYKPRLIIEPHVINSRLATDEICEILLNYGYATEILAQSDLPLPLIYAHPENMK